MKSSPKHLSKTHKKTSKNAPKKHTENKEKTPKPNQKLPKGDQNTTDKGGIQDGILLYKKKYTAKPHLLRERVHAGRKHADCDRISTRPCSGLHLARGRISVACGNSSAPGPREDNLHAKICKKFDARVNAGVFFAKFCLKL